MYADAERVRVTRVDAGRRNPGQRFNLGPKSRGHEVVDQIRADDDQEERERASWLFGSIGLAC